jgi:hypothetical protein
MAEFPLAINVQGDYGYKVIVVDDGDTIEQVIKTATDQIVGVLVPNFPAGTVLRARLHGNDKPIDNKIIVKDAKLMQMEAIQVYTE